MLRYQLVLREPGHADRQAWVELDPEHTQAFVMGVMKTDIRVRQGALLKDGEAVYSVWRCECGKITEADPEQEPCPH